MFARIAGAEIEKSCDQQCLKMEGMDDLGESSVPIFTYCLTHSSTLAAVVIIGFWSVDIFGEKSRKSLKF